MGVIIYGPRGCGKTRNADWLKDKYGCSRVLDDAKWPVGDFEWTVFSATDDLLLINDSAPCVAPDHAKENITSYEKAMSDFFLVKKDMVNSPPHYAKSDNGIECIDAIRAALGKEQFIGFLRGQVLKYQWRLGKKFNAVEDNAKSIYYAKKLEEVLNET